MNHCLTFASLAAATNSIAPPRVAMERQTKVAVKNAAIPMIEIEGATYRAGEDNGYWDWRPAHDVRISHGYRMAVFPVSNAQYEEFDPQHKVARAQLQTFAGDDDSVRFVTWQQANDYCAWLSQGTGVKYRLPTEAEWEWAFQTRGADLKSGREVENRCVDWYAPYSATQTDSRVHNGVHYRFNAAWLQQTPAVEPFALAISKEATP